MKINPRDKIIEVFPIYTGSFGMIDRLGLICFVATCTLIATSHGASLTATDSMEEEVCNTNYFRASCGDDEVIIVETAQYGRYQLGTCISEGFGYLGCMHDVMMEAESYCSGRKSCEIRVDDTSFPRAAPCHKDLKNHLWISYRCYKVITPNNDCYPNGNLETIVDLTKLKISTGKTQQRYHDDERPASHNTRETPSHHSSNSFLLSSWVTEQTGCGTADSPWVVLAGEGQRVNLTLYDFSPEAVISQMGENYYKNFETDHSVQQQNRANLLSKQGNRSTNVDHGKPTCRVLATIRESPHFRSNTICSNQGRVVNVATSLTNRIELRFLVGLKSSRSNVKILENEEKVSHGDNNAQLNKYQIQSHFLFQIKVIGCANPSILKGMRVNRMGNHVTIDCGIESGESWQMTCVDGAWTGHYRNCSQDSLSLQSRLEGIMPYATSIIIVGIIAVLMVCLILTAGIFCIKWKLRQDIRRSRFHQPKPSREPEYGYPPNQHPEDRKYPLLPGAQISSYCPVLTPGSDNLNEYATMRLLQQNEQLMRTGGMTRAGGVQLASDPIASAAGMMVIADNYRYPPPPPLHSTKTSAMTSFLAASESPQLGYRSDHIYECPDLVRQEVSRIASATPIPVCGQLTTVVKVDSPAARDAVDNASRNFSL